MVPLRGLPDGEVSAVFAYLRSIPPIRNQVPRPAVRAEAGLRGRRVYYAYGCHGCHGDSGQGRWDLRQEMTRSATDAELIAYIRHPERTRPGIAMPTWDGVIREDEYVPLVAYVRSLAQGAEQRSP
jgi:mono/diheme cytochrome c family protein